ncbi:hypothetical protein CHS0354_032426 [Potamilus streckersoni]|uniref:FAM20 C-terminal domain-containing protein n=1 Tax=Potamilus streckersoni TaxID=2493646 RepID=A0AAE0VZU7_9BIVA|nr:hypothetical protein CHS0354_032426 [Potamilus streckersoni]
MKILLRHILRMCKLRFVRRLQQFILLLFTLALIALLGVYATSNNSLVISVRKIENHTLMPDRELLCPKQLPELWAELNSLNDSYGLYPENVNMKLIKSAIRCAKIIKVETLKVQNSFKWLLTLEGEQKILYKPLLLQKDQRETKCNTGCEHPEYEVTAFVINRLLGFNNMPITTGRQISWFEEIYPVATQDIKSRMKVKNNTDVCFHWKCPYVEGISEFCFRRGIIQGSATVWLNKTVNIFYAYNSTDYQYHDFHYYSRRAIFMQYLQGDNRYCSVFRSIPPYTEDRMFYHVIDMAVIDYMLNNVDQRHTYIIGDDGKTIVNIMIDFGQSLCPTPNTVLGAPIYQCCSIRNSTFKAVYRLRDTLEQEFEKETRDDPLYPLLLPNFFDQIKRQTKELATFLDFCVTHKGLENIIID